MQPLPPESPNEDIFPTTEAELEKILHKEGYTQRKIKGELERSKNSRVQLVIAADGGLPFSFSCMRIQDNEPRLRSFRVDTIHAKTSILLERLIREAYACRIFFVSATENETDETGQYLIFLTDEHGNAVIEQIHESSLPPLA